MDPTLKDLREWLLREHAGTVCADRLHVIADELAGLTARGLPGAVVELGCYRGAMALWIRSVLDSLGDRDREIHVYDSFQGMPAPGVEDSDHLAAGELRSSPDDVRATHAAWGRPAPVIHPGWFDETLPEELPDGIAFAYLDGDFYDSTLTGLTHCVTRLVPTGVLLVDDYADTTVNPRAWDGLPGVRRACDAYFGAPSPVTVVVGEGDLAFGRYEKPEFFG
ncbi:class I SAM-dependent methyltransferase [Streptomyces sp. ISL-111]|uniref:TylF/MycF/NovP-related O-methyltransferase n=1 Tax=Streptomyces sp. ISL-111 TaxID=2819175 RepID=UPI001BEC9C85|nr:TylF/MycF/NovP-related O-methyltransferase [Streptomyces sp. ISL-111]MBT2381781.1 class I SAM-dependent methyltransferase [Streptomyces sp. ISL-111]